MNYEFTYSLRVYLEDVIPELTKVKIVHEGGNLNREKKPFATIESMTDTPELLSAGRKSYREIYRYQVGIFARDIGDRTKLVESVRTALRTPEGIPLYDDAFTLIEASFVCDVGGFTPIANNDSSAHTYDYHGYFDASITILRDTGEKEFTQ